MKIPYPQLVSIAFCTVLLLSCNHDDQAREAAEAQALEATKTPAPAQQMPNTAPDQPAPPKSAGAMRLGIQGSSASKGSETCVAITADNFNAIVSMQYTLKWDPKVLKFKELKGFGLPQLSSENFGRQVTDKGLLTYSWYDANVKGVSKAKGDVLYQICFEAIGASGSKSPVQIVNEPTVIEIANVNSEFYSLETTPGMVQVK
jgi:hypothetical protein